MIFLSYLKPSLFNNESKTMKIDLIGSKFGDLHGPFARDEHSKTEEASLLSSGEVSIQETTYQMEVPHSQVASSMITSSMI